MVHGGGVGLVDREEGISFDAQEVKGVSAQSEFLDLCVKEKQY